MSSRICGRLARPAVDLGLRHLGQLEGEPDVVGHRHVRVQGVVLEHHGDVPVLGLDVVDDLVADLQLAAADRLQPGDHPQRRRLPAARRADHHDELAVLDLEAEVVDDVRPVLVHLVDVVEGHGCHGRQNPLVGRTSVWSAKAGLGAPAPTRTAGWTATAGQPTTVRRGSGWTAGCRRRSARRRAA